MLPHAMAFFSKLMEKIRYIRMYGKHTVFANPLQGGLYDKNTQLFSHAKAAKSF